MENPFEIIDERLSRIESLLEKTFAKINEFDSNSSVRKIMNVEQVSNYLGVSKAYIYKLTGSNNIPHSKRGNRLYFEQKTINNWVLENKVLTQKEIERQADDYLSKNRNL